MLSSQVAHVKHDQQKNTSAQQLYLHIYTCCTVCLNSPWWGHRLLQSRKQTFTSFTLQRNINVHSSDTNSYETGENFRLTASSDHMCKCPRGKKPEEETLYTWHVHLLASKTATSTE